MNKVNIKITLSTPLILAGCKKQSSFAIIDGHIFIVNFQRLGKVASLMKKTDDFNNFYSKNKNITEWLQKYRLTNPELLKELSFYKLKNDWNMDEMYSFADIRNSDENFYIQKNLENVVYQNIKNLIIFDFLRKNTDRLNSYIEEILEFLKINPKYFQGKFNSPHDFIDRLFEGYKFKAENEIDILNHICIDFNCDYKDENIFEINKIKTATDNFFQESIRENIIMDFFVPIFKKPKIRIEKYIQLAEYINSARLKRDLHFINLSDTSIKTQMQNKISNVISTNFSFLNPEQIFYLCIEKNNKKMMNELFCRDVEKELFYYLANNGENLNFINYGILETC